MGSSEFPHVYVGFDRDKALVRQATSGVPGCPESVNSYRFNSVLRLRAVPGPAEAPGINAFLQDSTGFQHPGRSVLSQLCCDSSASQAVLHKLWCAGSAACSSDIATSTTRRFSRQQPCSYAVAGLLGKQCFAMVLQDSGVPVLHKQPLSSRVAAATEGCVVYLMQASWREGLAACSQRPATCSASISWSFV